MRKLTALAGYLKAVSGVVTGFFRFSSGAAFGDNASNYTANVVAGNPTSTGAGSSAVIVGGLRNASGHAITLVAPVSPGSGQAFRVLSDTGSNYGGCDWYGNLALSSLRASQFQMNAQAVASSPNTVGVAGQHVVRWTGAGAATFTLPAANGRSSIPYFIWFLDGSGGAGSTPITINRAGSDTIDGAGTSVTIARNHGSRLLMSDGVSRWYTMGGLYV